MCVYVWFCNSCKLWHLQPYVVTHCRQALGYFVGSHLKNLTLCFCKSSIIHANSKRHSAVSAQVFSRPPKKQTEKGPQPKLVVMLVGMFLCILQQVVLRLRCYQNDLLCVH